MSNADPIIRLENVGKRFGALEALAGVNLNVHPGEKVVIIGPSGSGKSTLLRAINRLEEIDSGRVIVDGADLYDPAVDINRVRMDVGMVFQSFNLFPHYTVLGNVTLAPVKLRGEPQAQAQARALELLNKVGIQDKAQAYPAMLSGGQQQRVAIARALAMSPKIMLFDEPTSALDPEMIGEVLSVMLDLAREGMTMVVVTHEMGFARQAADRIVFMDHGRIIDEGPALEFFESATHPRAKAFLDQIV